MGHWRRDSTFESMTDIFAQIRYIERVYVGGGGTPVHLIYFYRATMRSSETRERGNQVIKVGGDGLR